MSYISKQLKAKKIKTQISVIMAVYNGMPFLKQAIKSILSQSFKNFEFIIVDDGSSDGTWNYLKGIKDIRLRIIRNSKNIGLAASLNKAFKATSSQYVARMDADDISMPKRLETQFRLLNSKPKIDICGTWVSVVDEKGKKIGEVHYPVGDKDIKKTLRRVTPMVHPTWLLKREVLDKLGGYKPKWDFVEDYDFLLRARKYKMENIPIELLHWRTQKNRRSIKDIQKMYRKSFSLRWNYFTDGELNITYAPFILWSFLTTFVLPQRVKIYLNKKAGVL